MKITDPDVIKNGEKDLIKAVTDDLDLNAVKDVIKKRMAAANLSSKGGEIVVYNNEIAFRLDFDFQLSGSLMFDRQGNYIPESDETGEHENLIPENLDTININDNLEKELDMDIPDDELDDKFIAEPGEHDRSEDEDIKKIKENEDSPIAIDALDQLNDDPELEPEIEPGMESDELISDDLIDDDINDILKESQDFWELKKDE